MPYTACPFLASLSGLSLWPVHCPVYWRPYYCSDPPFLHPRPTDARACISGSPTGRGRLFRERLREMRQKNAAAAAAAAGPAAAPAAGTSGGVKAVRALPGLTSLSKGELLSDARDMLEAELLAKVRLIYVYLASVKPLSRPLYTCI